MIYSADFETTTTPDDCRVWAWGVCNVADEPGYYRYGNNIESFMEWLFGLNNDLIYFHNAKFDTDFIMNYLFTHNFEHTQDKNLTMGQFRTLISDDGKFYSMQICVDIAPKRRIVEIRDSLKLLNMSVGAIAKTFKLKYQKLSIDYDKPRGVGHEIDEEEKAYLRGDITIVAMGLAQLQKISAGKMTIGANALANYYDIIGGKKNFRRRFPLLGVELDADVRRSYKGGYVLAKNNKRGLDIGPGIVLDVNSLFPWAMHSPNLLPIGRPKKFDGCYVHDENYPLYIIRFRCAFELKEGFLPTVQLKNNCRFVPTEYLASSNDEVISMTMTNVDFNIFIDHYNVYELEFFGGWKFRAASGPFDEYIDYWSKIKIDATIEKNPGMRAIAKLYLNSLYGKFGTSPYVANAIPYYDDKIRYTKTPRQLRDTIYVPVASFITANARYKTITSAQKVYDRVLYIDTDSLHLEGVEEPNCLEIDDTKLGAWKHESTFCRAKYLRQKCYIEDTILSDEEYSKKIIDYPKNCWKDDKNHWLKITVSGLPSKCYDQVTYDNFKAGTIYSGKLRPARVKGGTVLLPTTFEIKA